MDLTSGVAGLLDRTSALQHQVLDHQEVEAQTLDVKVLSWNRSEEWGQCASSVRWGFWPVVRKCVSEVKDVLPEQSGSSSNSISTAVFILLLLGTDCDDAALLYLLLKHGHKHRGMFVCTLPVPLNTACSCWVTLCVLWRDSSGFWSADKPEHNDSALLSTWEKKLIRFW